MGTTKTSVKLLDKQLSENVLSIKLLSHVKIKPGASWQPYKTR